MNNFLEGLKKKDRQIQKAFYLQHSKPIYNTIFRMVGNKEDAADIMQETFVAVFSKINTFKGESELATWLFRVAVNKTINHFNAKKNIWMATVQDLPEESEPFDVPDVQPVLHALKELPEGCRVGFNLHYIEGFQHKEITEILNISESTSKSQLNRAKKLLREILIKNKSYENR